MTTASRAFRARPRSRHPPRRRLPRTRHTTRDSTRANRLNALAYQWNADGYRRSEHRAWEGSAYQRFLAEKLRELERSGG